MNWNYRVVKEKEKTIDAYFFSIREVYYKEGKPDMWSVEPIWPIGTSLDGLSTDVDLMMHAFNHPVLEMINDKLVEI